MYQFILLCIGVMILGFVGWRYHLQRDQIKANRVTIEESVVSTTTATTSQGLDVWANAPTETFRGQIDRVAVMFQQWDYTRYRLQTNELVREGELNTERGFGDDSDAVVYILNWQQPEGEQIRYVRLSSEPEQLFMIDAAGVRIGGSALQRQYLQ